MPGLLDRIRTEMSTRLAELRPLVDEHARLGAALQALGDVDSRTPVPASVAPAAGSRSRASKTTPATVRKRAPRGANRLAVLQAAEERPGATSAELATVSGVQGNTLHALLARLVKSGELQKQTLPTGRIGYTLGHAQPRASADPPAADDPA
jgi:hypothetical protein